MNIRTLILLFIVWSTAIIGHVAFAQTPFDSAEIATQFMDSANLQHSAEVPSPFRFAPKEDWDKLIEDTSFQYTNQLESFEPIKKPSKREQSFIDSINKFFNYFSSGIGQILFLSIIIGFLVFFLYKVFKGNFTFIFGKKNYQAQSSSELDLSSEDLMKTDWELKWKQNSHDKKNGARFAFLFVLQILNEKDIIQYSIDKTNIEYWRAIEDTTLQSLFQSIMIRYEYAWYGNVSLSERDWEIIGVNMLKIKSRI